MLEVQHRFPDSINKSKLGLEATSNLSVWVKGQWNSTCAVRKNGLLDLWQAEVEITLPQKCYLSCAVGRSELYVLHTHRFHQCHPLPLTNILKKKNLRWDYCLLTLLQVRNSFLAEYNSGFPNYNLYIVSTAENIFHFINPINLLEGFVWSSVGWR